VTTSTRDRLVDEAMRLFGEQGYRATTVAQIERAAGLSPGSGGLYHHFPSKEALLGAGVRRHVDRLRALRDIRRVFHGLADMRSELVVTARFAFELLDEERPLLRILLSEPGSRPMPLAEAVTAMFTATYDEFAGWVQSRAPWLDEREARTVATVAVDALLGRRMTAHLLGTAPGADDRPDADEDEEFIATWVEMVASRLERPGTP
jgi:AcrR family transcriptional regulator